ncbi:hypothetical protein JW935_22720 [candidate division KSB1 bacterium]|nr:hypothetical protein [candidate division KSB1 bacterium]
MNHHYIHENQIIEAYLSHNLSPEQVDQFEEHMLFCKLCRDSLAEMEFCISVVQRAVQQKNRGNGKVHNRIQDIHLKPFKRKKTWQFMSAAAVVFFAIGSLIYTLFQAPEDVIHPKQPLLPGVQSYFFPYNKYLEIDTIALLKRYSQGSRAVLFKPNVYLQDLLENQTRNKDITVYLKKLYLHDSESKVFQITFKGHIRDANAQGIPTLKIFSNRMHDYNQDNFIYSFNLKPYFLEQDHFTFQLTAIVQLSDGLYYFTIQQAANDPLCVGNFRQGRL